MNINKILQIAGIDIKLLKESNWFKNLDIDMDDTPAKPVESDTVDSDASMQQFINLFNGFSIVLNAMVLELDSKSFVDAFKYLNEQQRIEVLTKVNPEYLPQVMNDPSQWVRGEVAKRIDPEYLPQMMNDESGYVRNHITERIDPEYLPQMMNDPSQWVRQGVAKRIDPEYLPQMMNDASEYVRQEVAERIDPEYLPQMMNDEDKLVRYRITERMRQLGMTQ